MQCDVLVVGGGPAGLSAAVVLARAGRSVQLFHEGDTRNHRSRTMHNYLGCAGISPQAFHAKAWAEAEQAGAHLHRQRITDVRPVPDGFEVADASGAQWKARFVLLATGLVDLLPDVPGAEASYGTSIFHCPYCDAAPWMDKALAAYGPGTNATNLAMTLRGWSRNVTAFTLGRTVPRIQRSRLEELGIRVVEVEVLAFEHNEGSLHAVRTKNAVIPIDALFFNTETSQASDLPTRLGCAFVPSGAIKVDAQQRSSVPGVYVAGDAGLHTHLVSVAAAEGAKAAIAMNKALLASGHHR